MRRRIRLTLALICVASLAVALPASAGLEWLNRKPKPVKRATPRAESFVMSTLYSGALRGQIVANGEVLVVSDKATVYEVGNGLVPQGTRVRERVIQLSGAREDGRYVVHSISVRPLTRQITGDGSEFLKERPITELGPR